MTRRKSKRRKSKRRKSKRRKSPKPTNPKLYAKVKAATKRKFKVYPSAYANGWLVREYKREAVNIQDLNLLNQLV